MARPSNPHCVSCGVFKDDSNTTRVKSRGNVLHSRCRACQRTGDKARPPREGRSSAPARKRQAVVVRPQRSAPEAQRDAFAWKRFTSAVEALCGAIRERRESDPGLLAFKLALTNYESAHYTELREQSDRDLLATQRRVADMPHCPWLNSVQCRECMREISEGIKQRLGLLDGRQVGPPTVCSERIAAQAAQAQGFHT